MIPQNIILHCSATEDSDTASWDDIKRFHTEMRGWSDIGYHYGIERINGTLTLLRGRKPWTIGAHCRAGGRNRDSLGLCVVGNFDHEAPDPELFEATVGVLAQLCFTFHIYPTHVYGHNEFEDGKTCPGREWDMGKTRRRIMGELLHRNDIGIYMEI